MGKYWAFFMGKPEDKLNAMLENRKAKLAKCKAKEKRFEDEIAAIELELSKRKNEK